MTEANPESGLGIPAATGLDPWDDEALDDISAVLICTTAKNRAVAIYEVFLFINYY